MSTIKFYCRPATPMEIDYSARTLLNHASHSLGLNVEYEDFALLAYQDEVLCGSIIGKMFLDWLHIDLVFVEAAERKKGIGREMMLKTFAFAEEYGLSGIEVWTQSWQAPDFYRKMGYETFAVFDDFIPGKKRYAFRYYLCEEIKPLPCHTDKPPLSSIIQSSVEDYFAMHGEDLPSSGLYERLLPLFEKPLLEVSLKATGGNQIKAASLLGINRNTLRKKISELDIVL